MKKLFVRNGKTLTENPYLSARHAWNSEVDRAFSSVHVWQLAFLAAMILAMAGAAGMIYMGSQCRLVPYLVYVDKLGEAVTTGPVPQIAPADPRVIKATLAAWIANARMVSPDGDLQRKAILSVYALLKRNDPALHKMVAYIGEESETSPFKRSPKMTVTTEISTVLPLTSRTWSVDWTETARDRDGAMLGNPTQMRATMEIYTEPPGADTTQVSIERNPLGIFIRDYNWQQKQ